MDIGERELKGTGLLTAASHGPEAGVLAARAAYIGGCAGTSNVDADTAKARAAYQEFLTLWKDADPDITILQQPRRSTRDCSEADGSGCNSAATHFSIGGPVGG
jgi:hypothetical protein